MNSPPICDRTTGAANALDKIVADVVFDMGEGRINPFDPLRPEDLIPASRQGLRPRFIVGVETRGIEDCTLLSGYVWEIDLAPL